MRKSANSFQVQVENFLLQKMESGEWSVGQKIMSERELSAELNVSRTTVRNAVLALTSRGYFERMIGQGTFIKRKPVREAGSSVSKGTLGYVVCKEKGKRLPIASEAFYFDVFSGIEEEVSRSGRHTLFTYLDDYDPDEIEQFNRFLDKVDGLVIEEARNTEFLERVVRDEIPAVLLAPTLVYEKLDLVSMDLASGVWKAVEYLRELGHEKIGIVNGPLHRDSARIRFDAWKQAIRAKGADISAELIDGNEDWSVDAGYRSMLRLLDRNPEMTAVFCANDLLAIGALSAMHERSLRVPDDLSIVGFDDTELARHAVPPLTTMRIFSRDMARSAARRVMERIDNGNLPAVRMEYPIELVVRKSCKEVNEGR